MRNYWTMCAAFVAAAVTLSSAAAETLPGPPVHPLKQLWRDANGIAEDAEAIRLRGQYCKPPNQPMKAEPQAAIDALRQQLQTLKREHKQLKTGFDDALGQGEIGTSTRAEYPKLDGLEAADHQDYQKYWSTSNAILTNAQKAIDDKQNALNRAPERDCSPPPPKTEEEIIGTPPPPVEPPPPPLPPPPPVDPLKGLSRPISRGVNLPRLENFYCSQAQKAAALALIPHEIAKVNANIAGIDAYIASLSTRRGELKARGVEQHWLDSMDYEVRNAETEKASQATTIQTLETTRRLVESTPVVDCTKEGKKEVGWLPGYSLGADYAWGELTIPDKPYLALEDAGDLFLGVADIQTEDDDFDEADFWWEYEFDCDDMPDLHLIGNPEGRNLVITGYVRWYDASLSQGGGSIDTTTEGLGIPGTGDPLSANPAGFFFANPAFNDVTGLGFRHRSDYDEFGLSFGQHTFYRNFTTRFDLGLAHSNLDTHDELFGSIPGFMTDFRYRTNIDTSNTSLFLRAGVEVPLDQFWDQSLRYAGEFSGFRIQAGAQGGVNFLDADGVDRLNLNGFVTEAQSVGIGKDDTTFSYQLGASLNYRPPGAPAIDFGIGLKYGQSDTHPVANRSGELDDRTRIEFETQDIFVGTLGTRFRF